MDLAIEIENLTYEYGGQRGISGIDLQVARGEIVGILGPNGSGKSTLLKVLATWYRPTRGRYRILGVASGEEARLRPLLGVVLQPDAHFDHLTGWENAWLWAASFGLPREEITSRLKGLFEWTQLEAEACDLVRGYSYGMRRKLSLIEALVHRPPVLLLDEPSLGLDYPAQVKLWQQLRQLARENGVTAMVATNDVREAETVCDRIVFLSRGQLVAQGSPGALLAPLRARVRVQISLAGPVPQVAGCLLQVNGVEQVAQVEDKLQIWAVPYDDLLARVAEAVGKAGGRLLSLQVAEPHLGDVFLQLTGEEMPRDVADQYVAEGNP